MDISYVSHKYVPMSDGIYIGSDFSVMTKDDLITWLKSTQDNPQFKGWDFDAITGGITEFLAPEYYYEMKEYFEKHIKK